MFTQLPEHDPVSVPISVDGRDVAVPAGISVAAAVLLSGLRHTRTTPVTGASRAPFCMMGVCYECLMIIDGQPNQRACSTLVRANMRIETQAGAGPEHELNTDG